MPFNDAMAAHIIWKLRLANYVAGASTEAFDSATVRRDDQCELGKWIHGEAAKFQSVPAYEDLLRKHADFHICAAEIIGKMEHGDKNGAAVILGGPFEAASRGIIGALVALRNTGVAA